jgi:voltage-gated potassium channel Kch
MVRKKSPAHNFLRKNWWTAVLLALSATGIVMSVWGFREDKCGFLNSFYETFQIFILHHSFPEEIPWQLQVGRWVIFVVFLWITFRLFFEIIAPEVFKNLKIKAYQNHIVICGLNKIAISLAKKYEGKQIIVLAEETNKYAENLKTQGVKLLIGDFTDENLWRKAGLKKASRLYAVIDSDKMNVKIAQSVFSYLENKKRENEALKCFVLIKDRELKIILDESDLFKYKTATFDGIPFNINELGIKYGIATNIDKILPKEIKTPPEILLIGLTEKTEAALLDLVHCLTMQRKSFRFTIVERNPRRIRYFQRKYAYFRDFAEIETVNEIGSEKQYDSVLICSDNPIEAVKKEVGIHYLF